MERQILVPLDGTDLAETILPHAYLLARTTGSSITLLRAIPSPAVVDPLAGAIPPFTEAYETWEADLGWADNALGEVARCVRAEGIAARSGVIEGDPATVIVTYAARHPEIHAIAMATHGRTGLSRLVLGSVAEAVLHAAPKPLLLIRPDETGEALIPPPARPYQTIVVPLDGSALAEQALEEARALAVDTGATLVLVSAAAEPGDYLDSPGVVGAPWLADEQRGETDQRTCYLEEVRQQLETGGFKVQIHLGHERPAATILSVSEQVDADLIVMSTHGRGGWQRLRLGSVAVDVVRAARRPVLLVRPATPAPDHQAVERTKVAGSAN